MNSADLKTMIDYHYWARDRLLAALEPLTPEQYNKDLASSFKSIRATVVHMYSAEWAWLSRWQGTSPTALLSIELYPDVASVSQAWAENERNIRAFTDSLAETGITKVIEYKLFNGSAGASPFWQMLQHVVNHASYHRGQVTTMLRQLGAAPPQSMDLITFYRTTRG
jgi:uncharacterized damage-inducible protein DinB